MREGRIYISMFIFSSNPEGVRQDGYLHTSSSVNNNTKQFVNFDREKQISRLQRPQ